MNNDFQPFPKIPRLFREVVITEKIDGSNAQVFVGEDGTVRAGSRKRWLTPESDNFGFASWVRENEDELRGLGPGRHYGEWWGRGIQRQYGISERRFSLFNTDRWGAWRPACCDVVPLLYVGEFDGGVVVDLLDSLRRLGSSAAPGFMRPEGVVIYHVAGRCGFKATIEGDRHPKSEAS